MAKRETGVDGMDVRILKARDVAVPMVPTPPSVSAEILRLRSDFLAGRKLTPNELRDLVLASDEGGNGNCNIC